MLSGTPPSGSAGLNSFVVRATDIGTGMLAGSCSHDAGTFTLAGSAVIGSTNDKLHFTYQTLSGDGEGIARISDLENTGTVPNTWVRLVRSGTTSTACKSANGTSWTSVGSTTNTSFASTCYIGLAVGSGSDTTLNISQFSNVSVTP